MFFTRQHLIDLGYQVLGIDFQTNNTYKNYVKYFPEHNSMVVFSTIFNNKVLVYKLTKEQFDGFNKGEFALSHNGKSSGTTCSGVPIKNYGLQTIFDGGFISRIKYLKEILDIAESIAKGEKIYFEYRIARIGTMNRKKIK